MPGHGLDDLELKPRHRLPDAFEERDGNELRGRGRDAEAHVAVKAFPEIVDLAAQSVHAMENVLGAGEQAFARMRQIDAAAVPDEELRAEFRFECRDLAAQGRLGDMDLARPFREAAAAGDRHKVA